MEEKEQIKKEFSLTEEEYLELKEEDEIAKLRKKIDPRDIFTKMREEPFIGITSNNIDIYIWNGKRISKDEWEEKMKERIK